MSLMYSMWFFFHISSLLYCLSHSIQVYICIISASKFSRHLLRVALVLKTVSQYIQRYPDDLPKSKLIILHTFCLSIVLKCVFSMICYLFTDIPNILYRCPGNFMILLMYVCHWRYAVSCMQFYFGVIPAEVHNMLLDFTLYLPSVIQPFGA